MSDRLSGASDYNTKIIEEFRANQGRVGGPWAASDGWLILSGPCLQSTAGDGEVV